MNNRAPESKQSRLHVGSIGIVTTLVYSSVILCYLTVRSSWQVV